MDAAYSTPGKMLFLSDIDAVAHRLAIMRHQELLEPVRNSAVMEGSVLGLEVQAGLFATGYNVRYLDDVQLDETVGRSLLFAFPLEGEVAPITIDGVGEIPIRRGEPILLCFGRSSRCRTLCRSGGSCAVTGFTVHPAFLERLHLLNGGEEQQVFEHMLGGDFSLLRLKPTETLRIMAHRMLDENYRGSLARIHLESCTLVLVAETARLLENREKVPAGMSQRHFDQVIRARELLDADVASPPAIDVLTRELGVNATTLRANFLKAFGTTIFGHVRNRRLEVAQFLLRTHDLTVSEIGYRVGFTNPAAFSTAYRKHFGHAPRDEGARRAPQFCSTKAKLRLTKVRSSLS